MLAPQQISDIARTQGRWALVRRSPGQSPEFQITCYRYKREALDQLLEDIELGVDADCMFTQLALRQYRDYVLVLPKLGT